MDRIEFFVNGVEYSVGSEVDSDTTLNDYLRNVLNLRGTKYMCKEGGCGACIVAVTAVDPESNIKKTFSVNSCLVSITSCKDWEITTIEEIGNRGKGYHPIQKNLAKHNGSQCGYCTPGWVMSMYSLMQNHDGMKMAEIENSFGSNTCRCTGFRPILDAFKEFASDAPKSDAVLDIEDLNKICKATGNMCRKRDSCGSDDWCIVNKNDEERRDVLKILLHDGKVWYRANEFRDIFNILSLERGRSYMLVAGNTAKGAYPIDEYPDVLIDISGIQSLRGYQIDQNLIIGAGTPLSEVSEIFKKLSQENDFSYLEKFYVHLQLVAHIPVKNIGTIAGNLMIKHEHNDFPSDLFLLFETVGAIITIEGKRRRLQVTLRDFLNIDMTGRVITNVMIPPLSRDYQFVSYKIMPRGQNAHAIVNAGFLYKLGRDNKTVSKATIVFGGLSSKFIHADNTELYLIGQNLFNNDTLQTALKILQSEMIVERNPPEPSVNFRRKLALGLFYKGIIEICPSNILADRYRSGARNLRTSRPVSHGKQVYDTNKAIWPLNEPIPKVEALIQCAGEAPYMEDIPTLPREVFAAFVLSTVAVGDIDKIDASAALKIHGVLEFYTAKDIPGKNSFTPIDLIFNFIEEEVLCNGKVKFFNQPIGVIVAETEKLANKAAKLVKVTYKNTIKPILSIAESKKHLERVVLVIAKPATDRGFNIHDVIKGTGNIYGQYHFTMETQVCVIMPSDDGLEVHSSTQWMDMVQMAISQALQIEENRINLAVRRVGGAYGAKISRATQVAVACSLVSYLMNRPCRFIMPMTSVMRAIGKRLPCTADYEVGVDSRGQIQYLQYNLYEDNGYTINEPLTALGLPAAKNCYNNNRWNFNAFNVTTDTAKNSWCRSPGTMEQIAMTELIMEHISYKLNLDPIEVRKTNFLDENAITDVINTIKKDSDFDNRKKEIMSFNEKNRWKKRGLRLVPLRWPVPINALFGVTITVYHGDGSVVITHGGIEIGQGINTKAVQVCAYTLNLPIEKIKVKASNVVTNANSATTGGSFTSESICIGVIKCCQILLDRLEPIRIPLGEVAWEVLIKAAHSKGVNLLASYNVTTNDQKAYNVYGATVSEVEVDILTGELQVLRVDILEDVGQSLSPEVDVGQVEGAFVMGLGYWTCENLVYDENNGELLTDRTWNYDVPLAKDIPIDFRIYFKRNSYNQAGVLGSKATGEPPMCMTISVAFAIREAISAARLDKGIPITQWFNIDGPCTNETIVMCADTRLEDFKLY